MFSSDSEGGREARKPYDREGGFQNRSNNRYGSPRPRFNSNGEGGRPQRPRFNRAERAYSSNGGRQSEGGFRPEGFGSFGSSNEGGQQYSGGYRRNTYNNNNNRGFRPSSFGGDGEQRPQRPRFNPNGGEGRQQYGQRPRFNSRQQDGGYQRSFRPQYGQGEGRQQYGQRPRFNNGGGNSYGQGGGSFRPSSFGGQRKRTSGYDPNAKYSMKKQIEYKEVNYDPEEPIRLNKFLANAGVCSRREADEFIQAGVVSVNGTVVTELGTKVKRSDEIKFHDQPINIEKKVYVLLNKPKDYVTTSDDPQARKTVMDLVKNACRERIYPVGRLDRNTTGVLLLTNDGDLASKLTHPKYLKKKVYHVYCDKNVTARDLDQIAAGITLEDGEIHADAISYASDTDKSQVGIEIHSGKNRIVRRIFESLGYRVIKLDRVLFAGLTKKNLRRGDWRFLTEQEVNMLRMGAFE